MNEVYHTVKVEGQKQSMVGKNKMWKLLSQRMLASKARNVYLCQAKPNLKYII